MSIYLGNAWLNINADCNLSCSWCYNQENRKSSITYGRFTTLVYMLKELGTESYTIIGGEPTVHSDFLSLLDVLQNEYFTVVTNGVRFSDITFLNECIKSGLQSVSFSLKGYNRATFMKNSGNDSFDKCKLSLFNLLNTSIDYSVELPIGRAIADDVNPCELDEFINECSIPKLTIADTRPYLKEGGVSEDATLISDVISTEELAKMTSNITVRLNSPLCHYPIEYVEYLLQNEMLVSQCMLRKGGGLFFDSNCNMILCNALSDAVIGYFGKDYWDSESLLRHIALLEETEIFQRVGTHTLPKCKACVYWELCGGNCLLHWINEKEDSK